MYLSDFRRSWLKENSMLLLLALQKCQQKTCKELFLSRPMIGGMLTDLSMNSFTINKWILC